MRVAILGGTGAFGTALATRLREAGHDVVLGSRDAERAAAAARELGVDGATNEDAVRDADLAVLATKAEGALETARALREAIGATPLLSVASELDVHARGRSAGARCSVARRTRAGRARRPRRRGAPLARRVNARRRRAPDEDALVCGDDADAKALALELAAGLVSGRALDAGPLASARALEGLTAVIVNLNKRYRGHAGIRVTGLP